MTVIGTSKRLSFLLLRARAFLSSERKCLVEANLWEGNSIHKSRSACSSNKPTIKNSFFLVLSLFLKQTRATCWCMNAVARMTKHIEATIWERRVHQNMRYSSVLRGKWIPTWRIEILINFVIVLIKGRLMFEVVMGMNWKIKRTPSDYKIRAVKRS